jgi:hypothetical protein
MKVLNRILLALTSSLVIVLIYSGIAGRIRG